MPDRDLVDDSLELLAAHVGSYAVDAYYFVQQGLALTAAKHHGNGVVSNTRHITGQQLCEGLRDLAIRQWGMMARTVLERWGVYTTLDFGRIVYAMIDAGFMGKTEDDRLEDFKNVYDFRTAFEKGYTVGMAVAK
ncbi:MAG: Minf_1886 family protein [Tepidisphaeraceae bacterium]